MTVSKEDMDILKGLYLRTGISEGYYHQHNGRDMVTITSPAYNGTSDKVLNMVKEKYLTGEKKIEAGCISYSWRAHGSYYGCQEEWRRNL